MVPPWISAILELLKSRSLARAYVCTHVMYMRSHFVSDPPKLRFHQPSDFSFFKISSLEKFLASSKFSEIWDFWSPEIFEVEDFPTRQIFSIFKFFELSKFSIFKLLESSDFWFLATRISCFWTSEMPHFWQFSESQTPKFHDFRVLKSLILVILWPWSLGHETPNLDLQTLNFEDPESPRWPKSRLRRTPKRPKIVGNH